ncbi:hypothetical protein Y032_0130g1560 [Ancylostoma ceylanicum]|uniref:Uncharacterized protein n=1 Tax=Ancylostoma ceylanicum TaxID=53326 RepID=A0A016T7J6_9BILA|nr:hypothetical protein Y032_0130g1560 [Ancylostoma ceylanicum]
MYYSINTEYLTLNICTVGVDGGDPPTASKRTRRDRAAHGRIGAAVANLGFLGICSSHLMLPNKKTN